MVWHVCQLRSVVDQQRLTEPEHQIRVRASVGDQDVGPLPGIEAERDIERVQRVARSAGDDLAGQADRLVGDHVQVGDAAVGTEVLAVRARVNRGDGHDKPHPVDPGDDPAARRLRISDPRLMLDYGFAAV